MALQVSCSNEQKVPVTVSPVTAAGNPAQVDGALRLTKVDGDGNIQQDPSNPLAFFVVSGSAPGVSNFIVEADADLQTGDDHVSLIQDTVQLTVTGANATSFGLTAGAPVAK